MKRSHFGWLLATMSNMAIGCGEPHPTDQYKAVSHIDATRSQQAIDTIASPDLTLQKSSIDADTSSRPKATPPTQIEGNPASDFNPQSDPRFNITTNITQEQSSPPKLLVPTKDFQLTSSDNAIHLSFDDIDLEKIFDTKEAPKDLPKYFPKWLNSLNGQRVRIRGYMVPTFQADELIAFTLARDTSACCFGPNPKVSYLIEVWMKKGKTSEYIHYRPFDVLGILHVGTEVTPGRLYTIDDAVVIPK